MAILYVRIIDSDARTVQFFNGLTVMDFVLGTIFFDNEPRAIEGSTVLEVNVPDALLKAGSFPDTVEPVADEKGEVIDKVPGRKLTLEVVDRLPFADRVRLPFRSLSI